MNTLSDTAYRLPAYIINLPQRKERRQHILQQFNSREEFTVSLIGACHHTIGAVGLWNSILKVIDMALEKEELILICEDDHQFTKDYTRDYLFQNLQAATDSGIDIFLGGIGGCTYAMPVSRNRLWVECFICTQFMIIQKDFFRAIKEVPFSIHDAADHKLSLMTLNKMTIHPFISIQKEFGYSDIADNTNRPPVTSIFEDTSAFFDKIQKIYSFYTDQKWL